MSTSHATCIIPARGSSKGIPNKNTIDFCGKPLIHWTMIAADASNAIMRIIISTDDANIAKTCADAPITTVVDIASRPVELAGDNVTSDAVLYDILTNEHDMPDDEIIVFAQCTNPFQSGKYFDAAINMLTNHDSIVSTCPSHKFIWTHDNGSLVRFPSVDGGNIPRQKISQAEENGAFYIAKKHGWLHHKRRLFGKIGMFMMPPRSQYQIDEPMDLDVAKLVFERYHRI